MRSVRRVAGLVFALLTGLGSTALAGEDPSALANRALALFQQEARRAEALDLLHDALDVAQGPLKTQIMVNLGKAYGSIGRSDAAWAYLTWAVEREPALAGELRDALSFVTDVLQVDRVRVQVDTEPADAMLLFGAASDRIELPAPTTWWVGAYELPVLARRAGYAPTRRMLSPTGPSRVVVALEPEKRATDPVVKPVEKPVARATEKPATKPAEPPIKPVDPGSNGSRVPAWKWAVLGSGAALALAGTGTFGGALAKASDLNGRTFPDRAAYDDAWASDVKPLQLASYVLWGVGGATLLTGGVLVVLDAFDQGARAPARAVTLLPYGGRGAAGVLLGGSF